MSADYSFIDGDEPEKPEYDKLTTLIVSIIVGIMLYFLFTFLD